MLNVILFTACTAKPPVPPILPGATFDDHTLSALTSVADFDQLAVSAHGRSVAKFVISNFGSDAASTRYLDGHFYELHDEWYWFRLLNGQRIPDDLGSSPVEGYSFSSIADIYAWAKSVGGPLPLDLTWVEDGRLYSPRFYSLGLDIKPRALGLGALLHVPASGPRPERWAFQLEFYDAPSHAELVSFFEALDASLPPEISGRVFWVVRSPHQEDLARHLERQKLRFHERILRLSELSAPGELEVYNSGLTAGRLRLIRAGEPFGGTSSDEILVLEDVPDFLPPAAGVLTSVPQTALAHFNLLAKNRGIPNAYVGGVLGNQQFLDLARLRTPVVLRTTAPNELVLKPITEAQFATWVRLQRKPPVAVQHVDANALPYSQDLRSLRLVDADALRPSIGGKATGYLALLEATPDATPDAMEAVSIRAYVEHLAPFRSRIATMLTAVDFQSEARVRYLALEGEAKFRQTHSTTADTEFVTMFLALHPAGDLLGDLARAGGLKAELRAAPLAQATLSTLTDTFKARFAHYAVTQGLRFRSSSTAEDVEGFNGAGLYDSNTGFIDAAAQPTPSDRKQTIEWALKKTWASYWSFEAFEERTLENVDHLSGNMAVVVHARFDDAREVSNGVFLLTLSGDTIVMDLNVQAGALSVTNPTSTQLPEVDRVTFAPGAPAPRIERLRGSTVVPAGTLLLADAQLLETFGRACEVAKRWLAQENASRTPATASRTLVLDFEFRQVSAGWPALRVGENPSRIVLKQARSLEPGLRALPSDVAQAPVPRGLLARARRVERRTCESAAFRATLLEVLTNPASTPDVGHSVEPFTASFALEFKEAVVELGVAAGDSVSADHLTLTNVRHPDVPTRWSFDATLAAGQVTSVQLREGRFALTAAGDGGGEGARHLEGSDLRCSVSVLFSTPAEFLLGLL
jgi:hypothetical protein